jgi:hypothetical protein
MLEAFFSLSSLITENTVDVQMFLWLRYIPHTEYGKSTAMKRVIIKGILYREVKTSNVHIILRRFRATIVKVENQ